MASGGARVGRRVLVDCSQSLKELCQAVGSQRICIEGYYIQLGLGDRSAQTTKVVRALRIDKRRSSEHRLTHGDQIIGKVKLSQAVVPLQVLRNRFQCIFIDAVGRQSNLC